MRLPSAAVAFALVLAPSSQLLYAQPTIGPNVDITAASDPGGRPQNETTIAVHPGNPNILVAGAHDQRLVSQGGHTWHGYYRSVDGGSTWSVSLVPGFPGDNSPEGLASPLHGLQATFDPTIAFDRQGNVYYAGGAFKFKHNGRATGFTGFVAKYVNDGADFAFVTLTADVDKPWIAVDTSGGPRDGTVYVVHLADFKKIGPAAGLMRSTDGGATFSAPVFVADAF